MSAVQLKTKVKALTALDQAVQVRQSLQIAQASLGISIGCIAYLRYLLPDECFAERYYGGSSNAIYSYEDVINNTRLDDKGKGRSKVQVLKRGYSEEVDQLLNWIELGIFDALEKNFLAAVQFAIFTDRSKLEDIVESYTFSFRYQGSVKDGTRGIAGMDISSRLGAPLTLKDSRSNLNRFLRQLCTLASALPELPDERYLTIRLYYTDDCPTDYEPKGFKKCDGGPLYFSETNDVQVQTARICVKAGYHDVSLKVDNVDVVAQRDNLVCTAKVMADFDNEVAVNAQRSGAGALATDRPSVLSEFENNSKEKKNQHSYHMKSKEVCEPEDESMSDAADTQNTEIRRDTVQKAELRNMLVAQSQSSNVMETQEQEFSSQVAPQSSLSLALRVKSPLHGFAGSGHSKGSATLKAQANNAQQCLPDGNIQVQLQISKAKLARLTMKKTGNTGERSLIVSCECGIRKVEEEMLRCDCCGHQQHVHCYGFHSDEDTSVPESHFCYTCLLDGEEGHILKELSSDCILRRALKKLHENGDYPIGDTQNFAHLLGCPVVEAQKVTADLKEQGYLVPINLKKRAAGVRKFRLVRTETQISMMQRQYFEPVARIAHHYEVQKTVNALPQSMMDSMLLPEAPSDSLPPSIAATGDIGRTNTNLSGIQTHVEATEDEETDELVPTTPRTKSPWISSMVSSTASEKNTPESSRRSSRLRNPTWKFRTGELESVPTKTKRKNTTGESAPPKRMRASQIDQDYLPVKG